MNSKLAKDIRIGDRILLDDGRAARVLDTGPGMMRGSVLIDFSQPIGEPVNPAWACVDRHSEVALAD